MAKPEWGAKHTCLSCGAKFYDMGKNPITCPACDAPFTVTAPGRTRRARKVEVKPPETKAASALDAKKDTADDEGASLIDDIDEVIDDDEDDEDDAIVALAADDDDDEDDVLAEVDVSKDKISDE